MACLLTTALFIFYLCSDALLVEGNSPHDSPSIHERGKGSQITKQSQSSRGGRVMSQDEREQEGTADGEEEGRLNTPRASGRQPPWRERLAPKNPPTLSVTVLMPPTDGRFYHSTSTLQDLWQNHITASGPLEYHVPKSDSGFVVEGRTKLQQRETDSEALPKRGTHGGVPTHFWGRILNLESPRTGNEGRTSQDGPAEWEDPGDTRLLIRIKASDAVEAQADARGNGQVYPSVYPDGSRIRIRVKGSPEAPPSNGTSQQTRTTLLRSPTRPQSRPVTRRPSPSSHEGPFRPSQRLRTPKGSRIQPQRVPEAEATTWKAKGGLDTEHPLSGGTVVNPEGISTDKSDILLNKVMLGQLYKGPFSLIGRFSQGMKELGDRLRHGVDHGLKRLVVPLREKVESSFSSAVGFLEKFFGHVLPSDYYEDILTVLAIMAFLAFVHVRVSLMASSLAGTPFTLGLRTSEQLYHLAEDAHESLKRWTGLTNTSSQRDFAPPVPTKIVDGVSRLLKHESEAPVVEEAEELARLGASLVDLTLKEGRRRWPISGASCLQRPLCQLIDLSSNGRLSAFVFPFVSAGASWLTRAPKEDAFTFLDAFRPLWLAGFANDTNSGCQRIHDCSYSNQ